MSMISTNYTQKSSVSFADICRKKTGTAAAETFRKERPCGDTCILFNKNKDKKESIVDEYIKKNPQSAAHVNKQVQAGKKVREKNKVENISAEDMSMDEYKKYFYALLNTIPYDPTRMNDECFLTISEKGWEQMKKDPDYEAWILGYFVEDRAVRNPFFGWGGNIGSICFEHFGASIEEHHGEGFSKSAINGKSDKDKEESWWTKRSKRMKALLKEQQLKASEQAKAKEEANLLEYRSHQLKSHQRLHNFLTGQEGKRLEYVADEDHNAALALAAYENTAGLFQGILREGRFRL